MERLRAGVVLAALVLAPGCLERDETIVVEADGTARVTHVWRGGAADLDGGGARLPAAPAWVVERRTVAKPDGKTEEELRATAEFASVAAMPQRFGPEVDPLAARALRFTTELDVARGRGVTRYSFARRYAPRPWAEDRHLRDRFLPDELDKQLGAEDATPEQRRELVRRLIDHERALLQSQADRALRTVLGTAVDAEVRLRVRNAVAAAFDAMVDLERALLLIDAPDAEIVAFVTALRSAVDEAAVVALGAGAGPARRLVEEIAALRHERDVTEDLADERFTVRVLLPGTVVWHNADAVEDGVLVWRFDGDDLRDREHELLAIAEARS